VALDGAGWHPAAWREADARPDELFTARYWSELAQESERGRLDFLTIEDSLALQSGRRGMVDRRTDQVRGRLDATLLAARIAPTTSLIGIVPVVTTTHTEPFHVSKAIATLDYVSNGRAGLQARISATDLEARQFGRRVIPYLRSDDADPDADPDADLIDDIGDSPPSPDPEVVLDLFDEAAEVVDVVRRLWDSWEDDAEIRHVATGRFIDRDKLHYINFVGPHFSVKGPSITPRPPQGQPLVCVLAHIAPAFRLAARSADVVFITPRTTDWVRSLVATVRTHEVDERRQEAPLKILIDITVFLDHTTEAAQARKDRLDALDGQPLKSDALVFAGTAANLAGLMVEWHAAGADGFRLRPGSLPHDLKFITQELTSALRDRGVFSQQYVDSSLRARLGLTRPANVYAN
jgi:alkanesulfonate monooxygenase SsuD/methylene tetrahydromethanopterin reductase-like flavin-dependent oxidoreductase (luciferase family)